MKCLSSLLLVPALLLPACGALVLNSQTVRPPAPEGQVPRAGDPSVVRSFVTLHDRQILDRSILNFATGWPVKDPLAPDGPLPKDLSAYVSDVGARKVGDLSFSYEQGQVLISWCRRIMPLGPGFLNHLPTEVAPKFDDRAILPVRLGDRFLVGTVDGKYALVRAAQRWGRALVVEYIYQPNGSTVFPRTSVVQGRLREHFAAREASSFASALRGVGLEVCFEQSPKQRRTPPLWQLRGDIPTVEAALEDYTKRHCRDYAWCVVADDSMIVIHPREHSLLLTPIAPELAREFDGSWIDLVRRCTESTGIRFPARAPEWRRAGVSMGPVPELPPDQNVKVDLREAKCLLDVFDRICAATSMYFELHYTGDPRVPQLAWHSERR